MNCKTLLKIKIQKTQIKAFNLCILRKQLIDFIFD